MAEDLPQDDQLSEAQLAKLEALRAALIAGEESGPSTEFDFDVFIAEMHDKYSRQLPE